MISRWLTRTSTRRPTRRGVERVVVGVEAQVGVAAAPASPSAGRCRALVLAAGASPRAPPRAGRRAGPAASGACSALAFSNQASSCTGSRDGWRSAGRARSSSPDSPAAARPLPSPAGLLARRNTSRRAAARRTRHRHRVGRPPPACRHPSRSHTISAGSAAQRPQTAAHAPQHVRCLLGEDQRARASARIAQTRDHDPPPAHLAVTDRDRRGGLPQIPLADLARAIDRALEGPPAARTAGGPRADSHPRSSCRHRIPAARSAPGP